MLGKIRGFIIRNMVVGLIVIGPMVVSVYVLVGLLNFSDTFLFQMLPKQFRPNNLIGFRVPGLGIAFAFLLILGAGFLTRNYLGMRALLAMEKGLARVPVLRGLYFALRQFIESLFVDRSEAFRKVVAIEYPRRGLFTLAFVTGTAEADWVMQFGPGPIYTVFVPTTPNPTSGFLLFVPESETIEVDLRIDEAFRLIVSGGILSGNRRDLPFGLAAAEGDSE